MDKVTRRWLRKGNRLSDKIGELRQERKNLKEEIDTLGGILKDLYIKADRDEFFGKEYSCKYDSYEREDVDWKALALKLGATKRQIKRYTKKTPIERLLTSKIKEE